MREVGLLIIGQHLAAGLTLATDPDDRAAVLEDLQRVLRAGPAETR